jgi:hypothetical protein
MSEIQLPKPRFTLDEAQGAVDKWGFNCGPASICAVIGMTPDELRPHLGDFEQKRYTNPTLMWDILDRLHVIRRIRSLASNVPRLAWPDWGLARIQWEGPWTEPGVPLRARYRHTHWVAACSIEGEQSIFDVNCMCIGGWVPLSEWVEHVVPWLLGECEPKAGGRWHITHSVEILDGRSVDAETVAKKGSTPEMGPGRVNSIRMGGRRRGRR